MAIHAVQGGRVIMEAGTWILSFCIMAMETWGNIYFFDTFMERKKAGQLEKCRYVVLYIFSFVVAYIGSEFLPMWMKVLLMTSVLTIFCAVFYKGEWKQCIFFSGLNYSLLLLTDLFTLLADNLVNSRQELYALDHDFLLLPMKMVRIFLLLILQIGRAHV